MTNGNSSIAEESTTQEERRRSRQQEIEHGHLSPKMSLRKSAVLESRDRGTDHGMIPVPIRTDKEVAPEQTDIQNDEPPIVMSATSYPGQGWEPEYMAWDDN